MSTPLLDAGPLLELVRRRRRAAATALSAAAPAWLREPLLHFVVAGRPAVRDRPRPGQPQPTTRTRSSWAPTSTTTAIETFKAARGREPERRGAGGAAPRLARQRGAVSRRPRAAGRQGRPGHPRARDLQGAERGRQQRQAAAGRRASRCARGSSSHRDKYDEPARYDFEEAALAGDNAEAAVRAVRDGAERAARPATPRPGCACSRAGRTRTWFRATGRSSPRRSTESQPGHWHALQTRDGWRAMRLDAVDAAEAGGVRGPARRGAAGLDRRHRRRAAHRRRARAGQEVHGEARGARRTTTNEPRAPAASVAAR